VQLGIITDICSFKGPMQKADAKGRCAQPLRLLTGAQRHEHPAGLSFSPVTFPAARDEYRYNGVGFPAPVMMEIA